MQKNIRDLFTEEEWNILEQKVDGLCDKIQNCPAHIDESAILEGENDD